MSITVDQFVELCTAHNPQVNKQIATAACREIVKSGQHDQSKIAPHQQLYQRWYKSLTHQPDYSVYDDEYYFIDMWGCWRNCSSRYLRDIQKVTSTNTGSVVQYLQGIRSIVDLGCGMGLSTVELAKLFPTVAVHATNVPGYQYDIATKFAQQYNFKLHHNVTNIGQIDMVFASEYFEHFQDPIQHLDQVIAALNPKYMIIANAFTADAIGHFNEYIVDNKIISKKHMARIFNTQLKQYGYKSVKTNLWNNRPRLWEKL